MGRRPRRDARFMLTTIVVDMRVQRLDHASQFVVTWCLPLISPPLKYRPHRPNPSKRFFPVLYCPSTKRVPNSHCAGRQTPSKEWRTLPAGRPICPPGARLARVVSIRHAAVSRLVWSFARQIAEHHLPCTVARNVLPQNGRCVDNASPSGWSRGCTLLASYPPINPLLGSIQCGN
jgi:hypothetical protein